MRIDYCPKCNKARLKYDNADGKDIEGHTQSERYGLWKEACANGRSDEYLKNSTYGLKKWCPRCKEWVKPVNKPYIGQRGIG